MSSIEQAQAHFDERMAALAAGELTFTSTVHVELPDGDEADVAIKVLDPVTRDRLVPTGIARYLNGRVVGESHAQGAMPSSWQDNHRHQPVQCMDFELKDGLFVPRDTTVPTRLHGNEGLGMALGTVERLESCGAGYDLFWSKKVLEQARRMRGEGEHQLFIDPALQFAVDQRLAEVA